MMDNTLKVFTFLYNSGLYLEAYDYIKDIENGDQDIVNMQILSAVQANIALDYETLVQNIVSSTLVTSAEELSTYIIQIAKSKGLIEVTETEDFVPIPNFTLNTEYVGSVGINDVTTDKDYFSIAYNYCLTGNPSFLSAIQDVEALNNGTEELRRIAGFKIKYSIVTNNFDYGYNAIQDLFTYFTQHGKGAVDVQSIVSEYINHFLNAGYDFNDARIQEIYSNKAFFEGTPAIVYLELGKIMNEYIKTGFVNKSVVQSLAQVCRAKGYTGLPQYAEIQNLLNS